ncbi:hypothetical protein B0T25DRAFT_147514 [Lasiosphaeria hispida]|uniref:Uncharacterized protein n=1 Tax=Lasiosphaeria hispida TaxID=260671 RepID=A0AAJ0MG46_9PEZI|nr:hypothetical protein B0T25DRAFT_147514 [Lasiosphaeria hispida]
MPSLGVGMACRSSRFTRRERAGQQGSGNWPLAFSNSRGGAALARDWSSLRTGFLIRSKPLHNRLPGPQNTAHDITCPCHGSMARSRANKRARRVQGLPWTAQTGSHKQLTPQTTRCKTVAQQDQLVTQPMPHLQQVKSCAELVLPNCARWWTRMDPEGSSSRRVNFRTSTIPRSASQAHKPRAYLRMRRHRSQVTASGSR